MVARLVAILLLILLGTRSLPAIDSPPETSRARLPTRVDGVEIRQIHGWFACLYPWRYDPTESTVYPVRSLWRTPGDYQTPADIAEQNRILDEYGSGADVLAYSPNPAYPDHNHWLRTYFRNGNRPFFIAYEHVFGTRMLPADGAKDMNLRYNRQAFKNDIDAIVRNVVVPYAGRYVTYEGRAVIFLWAVGAMYGDFASLLDEVRATYPVAFIGSVGVMNAPSDPSELRTSMALDGFMEYGLYAESYERMTDTYAQTSGRWREMIRQFKAATAKPYLFIPTFQAAFDNSKVSTASPPMYPRSRGEVLHHAERIAEEFGTTYDPLGPFVVFSELFEGAAVIESQCVPDTLDKSDRYIGCGRGRLEVLKEVFGSAR